RRRSRPGTRTDGAGPMTTEPTTTEANMSNDTTQHTPADVRERVNGAWATVEAAALAQANVLDSHYGGQPAKAAEIRNAVEQVAALLRTPRGEGEAWRAFLDALDEYEAAANLWADPEGPTAADMERLRQSRRRVIECACALAARRGEAPGDGPVGAVCANCGDPNVKITGGELDPDEAV